MNYKLFFAGLSLLTGMIVTQPLTTFAGKHKPLAPNKFTITGDISNMPAHKVKLEMLRANDSVSVIDSQMSDASGHFILSGTNTETSLYRVHFESEKFILLSIDKGDVKIVASWPLGDYTVTGSASSTSLKTLIDGVKGFMTQMNGASGYLDSIKASGNQALYDQTEKAMKARNDQFTEIIKKYADTVAYEPNAVLATRVMSTDGQFLFYDAFNSSLDKRFPGTKMTTEYHQFFERIKDGIPQPTEIGDKAPELKLQDTAGKTVTLSSLRGHYVLLDFWASWCGPCRAENPNVLAAYNKFKNKNFTILAVSLDNKKDAWLKAVQHDQLLWTQVSDLRGWQSAAAARYGVHAIPQNFLLDPDGKIVGKNLRGAELENKLQEVLK